MAKDRKIFKIKSWHLAIFVLVVTIIAFLSLWRALGFHFWRDDWVDVWSLVYHPETSIYFNTGITIRRHPGLAIEKVIISQIFGLNVLAWQVFGIVLRILDSLVVALMIFGLTKSKRAGILAGLFMASLIGGLESVTWISAHYSAIFVFFFSLGVYFWAKSFDLPEKDKKNFILALVLLSVAVSVTPAIGLLIFPALAFWDFLSWVRTKDKQTFLKILFRDLLLGLALFVVISQINSRLGMFTNGDLLNTAKSIFSNPSLVKNYLSSLGNLLMSWLYPVGEPISLGTPTTFNLTFGLLLILMALLLVILFLFKKTRQLQVAVFFSLWMFLFYFSNWSYEKTLVVGSSHRYLAISAVALSCLVATLVYKLKLRFLLIVSFLFIALNIIASNRLLENISGYRSYKIVQPIWDQIDREVAPGEKDFVFMYFGSDLVWGTSMSWSGSIPFGIKRGIKDEYNLPIVTGDRKLVAELLCKKDVYRPSIAGWLTQKERIPISHLYAWEWKEGVLTNVSQKERRSFIKEAPCKVLP